MRRDLLGCLPAVITERRPRRIRDRGQAPAFVTSPASSISGMTLARLPKTQKAYQKRHCKRSDATKVPNEINGLPDRRAGLCPPRDDECGLIQPPANGRAGRIGAEMT